MSCGRRASSIRRWSVFKAVVGGCAIAFHGCSRAEGQHGIFYTGLFVGVATLLRLVGTSNFVQMGVGAGWPTFLGVWDKAWQCVPNLGYVHGVYTTQV